MTRQPFEPGTVVVQVGQRSREGVSTIGDDLKSLKNRDLEIVWAYWSAVGGEWTNMPTWVRASIVELHPDPDPVLASFTAWELTR